MEFLHDDTKYWGLVLHLDLKAANLLVDANYRIKLGDLGMARRLTESRQVPSTAGQTLNAIFSN